MLTLFLVFALGLPLFAAPPSWAQRRFITEYTLDSSLVEVPFEYKNHQIFVHGVLDGHKDLTFLFDTGASAPVIDRALNIQGYGLGSTTIQEAEGVTSADQLWVSDLSLGADKNQARVHNIAVLVTDLSQVSRVLGQKVDGIIGIPFCAGFVTEIDYEKKILRFYNPRTYSIASRVGDDQRSFLFNVTPINVKRAATSLLISGQLHPSTITTFCWTRALAAISAWRTPPRRNPACSRKTRPALARPLMA